MAKKVPLKHIIVDTSIGQTLIVGSERGLCGISIEKSRQSARTSVSLQFPQSIESADGFGDLPQRLKRYACRERITFNDMLDFGNATSFQQAVWKATCTIPYGETRTYGWIAQRIGKPKAARAVGQALKANPCPIVVPCHRVIGKNGNLTGFSCGIKLKRRLLDLEAQYP